MTTTHPAADAPASARLTDGRDLTLDLARVVCVLTVVVVHLLFVGVGPDAAGGLAVSRPLEELPWFWAATWVGQIMPLFFVVGGFATATSLQSLRRRLDDPELVRRTFVHGRLQRLVRPALPLFVVLTVMLGAATALGVDAGLLDAIATGVGSPLWFLCAYALCQLVAPVMFALHETAPRGTLAALFVLVVLVDVAQFAWVDGPKDAAGMGIVGYLNLGLVWVLIQQLGFFYADGWFARRRPWQLALLAAVCWASLVPLTVWGPYSPDMLTNLNPATVPLVALGVGQAALLQLLKGPLTRIMSTRAAQAVVFAVGSRLMTIYLWHLPLILVIAGVGLLIPGAAPEAGGAVWWATRPLVLLVLAGLLALVAMPLARFERPAPFTEPAAAWGLAVAAVLVVAPTYWITVFGLELGSAVAGAAGFAVAAVVVRGQAVQAQAVLAQKPKSPPKPPKSEPPKSEPPKSDAPASDALASADAASASAPASEPSPPATGASAPQGKKALTSADPTT